MNSKTLALASAGVAVAIAAGYWLYTQYRDRKVATEEQTADAASVEETRAATPEEVAAYRVKPDTEKDYEGDTLNTGIDKDVKLRDPDLQHPGVAATPFAVHPVNDGWVPPPTPPVMEPVTHTPKVSEGTQGAFGEPSPYPTDIEPMHVEDYPRLNLHDQIIHAQVLRMGKGTDYFVTPDASGLGRESLPAFVTTELNIPGAKFVFADFNLFDREVVTRFVAEPYPSCVIACMQWPRGGRRDYYLLGPKNEVIARWEFTNDADAKREIGMKLQAVFATKPQEIEDLQWLLDPTNGLGGETIDDPDWYHTQLLATVVVGNIKTQIAAFSEGDLLVQYKSSNNRDPEVTLILPRGRFVTIRSEIPGVYQYRSNKSAAIGTLKYGKTNANYSYSGKFRDMLALIEKQKD